jgi:sulfatase maturation enzyme AslB (radical SAM superfamily)
MPQTQIVPLKYRELAVEEIGRCQQTQRSFKKRVNVRIGKSSSTIKAKKHTESDRNPPMMKFDVIADWALNKFCNFSCPYCYVSMKDRREITYQGIDA